MSSTTKVRPTASPRSERMNCQDSTDSDDLLCCTCTNARLAKLLTRICVVQVVTFIAAVATLSVFVRENVNEIEALKHKTGDRETESESGMSHLTPNQTSCQLALQELDQRMITLQKEMTGNLTLQADIMNAQSNVMEAIRYDMYQLNAIIGIKNSSTHDAHEHQSTFDTNITELHDKLLGQDLHLKQLEKRINHENITLESHSTKIRELEQAQAIDQTVLLNQTIKIADLESNFNNVTTDIKKQELRIRQMETKQISDNVRIVNHTNAISQLNNISNENNAHLQTLLISYTKLEREQIVSFELQLNLSSRIKEVEYSSFYSNLTLLDHDARILLLENDRSLHQYTMLNHTSRIIAVETNLVDANARLQNLITSKDMKSLFTATHPEEGWMTDVARFTYTVTDIANHYNTSTGIFTCVYPGIYLFELHVLKARDSAHVSCTIRKNQSRLVIALSNPEGDNEFGYYSGSTSVVLHLDHGDCVDVYCYSGVNSMQCSQYDVFSGVLIQAD